MLSLKPLGRFLTYAVLFSPYVLAAIATPLNLKYSAGFGLLDELVLLMLLGVLAVTAFVKIEFPARFLLWIPYLLLFVISLMANHSSLVMAVNLLFAYAKPFIIAVAAINYLGREDLPKIFRIFLYLTLGQIPFLLYQLAKLGYVTGTLADDYMGFLGDAHLVGGLAIVPSAWLLGQALWDYLHTGKIRLGSLLGGLALFFIPIFCEAKHIYAGILPGMIVFAFGLNRENLLKLIPKLSLFLVPIGLLIFYFGFQYVRSMDYQSMFQLFQKADAYAVTFFELPEMIPYPSLGAGPGMYGSAIALKSMPPLAEHFFSAQMQELEVTGTFMNPFSEVNGAIGELGYLGPILLLLPYLAQYRACWRGNARIDDGFAWGALFCASSLLLMVILFTIAAQSLVLHHITYPSFLLATLVLHTQARRDAGHA
jgi:hypothetical protein